MTKLAKRLRARIKSAQKKADRFLSVTFRKLFKKLGKIKFVRGASDPLYKKVVKPHPRLVASALCLILAISVVGPVAIEYSKNKRYELNEYAHTLLGESNPNLSKKITYNQETKMFQFNKEGKEGVSEEGNPLKALQSKVGAEGDKDEQQYSVDVSEDLSQGVTYYDNKMQLSFKLIPQFKTMLGQRQDGHLIFPLNGGINGQVAYTTEGKGLKENVVLYESPGDSLSMSYRIDLPESLEARLNTDSGDLEIYSADPALFGKITYGTSDDRAKVEQARTNSDKTFLTFVIPAPVVMGLNGDDQATVSSVKSKFEFSNNVLTVKSTDLDKATYPLSIDPTIVVDSTSDFQTGNMEDNNATVDSGSLKRTKLSGGSVGTWSSTTALASTTYYHDSVAYNGYMYSVGSNVVRRAPINSGGTLGSWSNSTLPVGRNYHTVEVYNGYMYVIGGSASNTVYYAAINSNGTLGTWNTTSAFTTPRDNHSSAVYNGYMYVIGGSNSTNPNGLNDVQYAPINANGTLGAWNTTTQVEGAIFHQETVVYNNYIYMVGGRFDGEYVALVSYAYINEDGTIGDWAYSNSYFNVPVYYHSVVVQDGYMYISGGRASSTEYSTVQYAPVNSDGDIGAWSSTNQFSGARYGHSSVAYNGYLYIIGGTGTGGNYSDVQYSKISPAGSISEYKAASPVLPDGGRTESAVVAYGNYLYVIGGWGSAGLPTAVQYAQIYSNGTLSSWSTTTSITGGRHAHSVAVYDGRIYLTGGTSNTSSEWKNDVQYATINANGTLSAWTPATAFGTGRYGHASVAYNGYLYVMGGYTNSGNPTTSVQVGVINSSGSVSSWTSGQAFPVALAYHAAVEYSGSIFVVGGATSPSATTDVVRRASIGAGGSLSSWTSEANYMPQQRRNHTAVISNGYLYVLGGRQGAAGSLLSSTIYAQINSNGIGSWSTAPSFSTAREGTRAVAFRGYIMTVGGRTDSTFLNDVQSAQINNGGPGTVSNKGYGTSFTTPRFRHSVVAYNGYLYVLGGRNGSSADLNDVQFAAIRPDSGLVWTWATTSSFATPRNSHTAFAHNGYMYVLGGTNSVGPLSDVQRAQINQDGTLGSWAATTSMNMARSGHSTVVYNDRIYVLGGSDGGPFYSTYYASGATEEYVVPSGVSNVHVEVVGGDGASGNSAMGGYGGYVDANIDVTPNETLYVNVGSSGDYGSNGHNGGGAGSDGSVGLYTSGGGASDIRKGGNALSNRVVIAGGGGGAGGGQIPGYNGNGGDGGDFTQAADGTDNFPGYCNPGLAATDTAGGLGGVYSGSISGLNGALGVGGDSGGAGTSYAAGSGGGGYYGGGGGSLFQTFFGCGGGGGTSYIAPGVNLNYEYGGGNGMGDGYVSISYGSGPTSDVQYASINPDGSIGTWQSTTNLTSPRNFHASVAYNGYIYVLGGLNNSTEVQYAAINSNGTLGAWTSTNRFNVGRYGVGAVAYNGYLYILGGWNNGLGFRGDVQYAAINSNGTLGAWTSTTNLMVARTGDSSQMTALHNGRIYSAGGNATGGLTNTVEFSSINSIPRKTSYSKVVDLKVDSMINGINYTGVLPAGTRSINYKTAGANGVFGSKRSAAGFSCSATGVSRYVQLFATIDDTGLGVYRDDSGQNYASLDSLVINTKPLAAPSDHRLRHGAFFNNQVLQPFNTNNNQC